VKTATNFVLGLFLMVAVAQATIDPFSKIPNEERAALSKQIEAYVSANQTRDWGKVYALVSDTGRGGVSKELFVKAMEVGHGKSFANEPDLLQFDPKLAEADKDAEYDVYGCAKAQREGETYRGVAVVHAVFEHGGWFFTGWSFTMFPNEPCKALSNPSWEPFSRIPWKSPMEELRSLPGVPFHAEAPKR
jgi:hypothetical protein